MAGKEKTMNIDEALNKARAALQKWRELGGMNYEVSLGEPRALAASDLADAFEAIDMHMTNTNPPPKDWLASPDVRAQARPVTSLFHVTLQFVSAHETRPVGAMGFDRLLAVVAKDAEAAIERARDHVHAAAPSGEHARVVSVEFIHAIDVP
jgi:hypothetical protein